MNVLAYLGRPWVAGVFDCWGLVREIYQQELGIRLPHVPVKNYDARTTASAFACDAVRGLFIVVREPCHLSVVGMGRTHRLNHCGIYLETIDGPRILHNRDGCGVICESLLDLNFNRLRILGYFKYVG